MLAAFGFVAEDDLHDGAQQAARGVRGAAELALDFLAEVGLSPSPQDGEPVNKVGIVNWPELSTE